MELVGFQTYWEKGSTFPVHLLVDGTGFQACSIKGFLLPVELPHWVTNILGESKGFHFPVLSLAEAGNWVPCIGYSNVH